jgi:hypothetical protein
VAGTADALQPRRHGPGRLDLEDEIHGAHVDAELERGGGHETRQLARLEHLLDDEALLAGHRAVVGAGDLALGELVQAQGQSLGAPAVVDEDDRRAVGLDEAEQLGVDGRPDRAPRGLAALERVERRAGVGFDHGPHRDVDAHVELLAHAGVDHRARALRADEEAPDLLERVLGGRERDALHFAAGELGQPLERQRQVRAALGPRHGVDLVDDDQLGVAQELLRAGGEHEVERLRRGDEYVRGRPEHLRAVALRRVARAQGDREVGADAAQGGAEIALDVVGERLERGDVDESRAPALVGGGEAVEPVEEGGQRLARPRRRGDQRVLAGGDRGPRLRLRGRRRGERAPEPFAHARGEVCERCGGRATSVLRDSWTSGASRPGRRTQWNGSRRLSAHHPPWAVPSRRPPAPARGPARRRASRASAAR